MLPGDIVFSVARVDDNLPTQLPRAFIRAAQWLKARMFDGTTPNVPIVHAAIAWGPTSVIESVGHGIQVTDLAEEQPPRSALIYSCTDEGLGAASAYLAGKFWEDTVGGSIKGDYSVWKAMFSVFKRKAYESGYLQERINDSVQIGNSSFCSQFVANAYEAGNLASSDLDPVPATIFNIRPTLMTPWELASICDNDSKFYFAGFWQDGAEVRL